MSFEVMLIGGIVCALIYFVSMGYISVRMDTKRVETNLLTILILLCPLVNTIIALYLLHKKSDYKKSIEKLFND